MYKRQRLTGWTNKLISWAGRDVLIKAVAQAIPTYAMSIFKLPKDLCSSIQAMINRFWWGHDPDKRKIHWVGSARLCARKRDGGLGFRHLESFNDALLAKQVWRLIQSSDSLVSRLLKSKYYPNTTILNAALGANPSYAWRSLHGVLWVIEMGSRWIVGNGDSLKAWRSRWLPRPHSFLPIPWRQDIDMETSVADLIDKEVGCWKEQIVRHLFLPIDAEQILRTPLCTTWPEDKLSWHFTTSGNFSVKSAYHLIRSLKGRENPSSSTASGQPFWKKLWALEVPPRIKMFGWKVGVGGLAAKGNIARRLRGFSSSCELCGFVEDSDVHALFACPVAVEIWSNSDVDEELWGAGPLSAADRLQQVASMLDDPQMGEYLAILWEIWNERNRLIFGHGSSRGGRGSAARAVQFVRSFMEFKTQSLPKGRSAGTLAQEPVWRPPDSGTLRLNFDAGQIGERGYGWGFVVRNQVGDILLMGVKQGDGFSEPEVEEARACLFALRSVADYGYGRLEVEGDCLNLIGRLQTKAPPNNLLGYFISNSLSFISIFESISWKYIKRGGNKVAHALAHLQPYDYSVRVWSDGGPSSIHNLASTDMCKFIELSI